MPGRSQSCWLIALGLATALLAAGCSDEELTRGCKNWCKCHAGDQSKGACRKDCATRLRALRKRDPVGGKQVIECLAGKGKRHCGELAACAAGQLKSKPKEVSHVPRRAQEKNR